MSISYLAVCVPQSQNQVSQCQVHGRVSWIFWELIELIQFHDIWPHTKCFPTFIGLVKRLEILVHACNLIKNTPRISHTPSSLHHVLLPLKQSADLTQITSKEASQPLGDSKIISSAWLSSLLPSRLCINYCHAVSWAHLGPIRAEVLSKKQ